MADENEKRKINRIQLFGFLLEKQREINVFRENPVFPESKRRLTFIFLGRENLLSSSVIMMISIGDHSSCRETYRSALCCSSS